MEQRSAFPLIQPLPALRHAIQERPRLAVEKLHVRRDRAASRGVAGYGARADRHHLDVGDVLPGLLRLEFRVEQVLGAGEDQRFRLDRGQRLGGVALKTRRGADVVPLIGPGLVDPVVGVERLQRGGLLRFHPWQYVHAVLELRRVYVRRARRQETENVAPQPDALLRRRYILSLLSARTPNINSAQFKN